jgi:hypothetical protein
METTTTTDGEKVLEKDKKKFISIRKKQKKYFELFAQKLLESVKNEETTVCRNLLSSLHW